MHGSWTMVWWYHHHGPAASIASAPPAGAPSQARSDHRSHPPRINRLHSRWTLAMAMRWGWIIYLNLQTWKQPKMSPFRPKWHKKTAEQLAPASWIRGCPFGFLFWPPRTVIKVMDVFYGLVSRGLLWMYLTVLLRPMTGIVLTQCGSWEVFMLYILRFIYIHLPVSHLTLDSTFYWARMHNIFDLIHLYGIDFCKWSWSFLRFETTY